MDWAHDSDQGHIRKSPAAEVGVGEDSHSPDVLGLEDPVQTEELRNEDQRTDYVEQEQPEDPGRGA